MTWFQGIHWMVVATAAGAILLWCKEGPEKLRVYALSPVVERLPMNEQWRYIIQMLVFIVLGTFVALLLTDPQNVRQAFAAGLGWTAGLSKSHK